MVAKTDTSTVTENTGKSGDLWIGSRENPEAGRTVSPRSKDTPVGEGFAWIDNALEDVENVYVNESLAEVGSYENWASETDLEEAKKTVRDLADYLSEYNTKQIVVSNSIDDSSPMHFDYDGRNIGDTVHPDVYDEFIRRLERNNWNVEAYTGDDEHRSSTLKRN